MSLPPTHPGRELGREQNRTHPGDYLRNRRVCGNNVYWSLFILHLSPHRYQYITSPHRHHKPCDYPRGIRTCPNHTAVLILWMPLFPNPAPPTTPQFEQALPALRRTLRTHRYGGVRGLAVHYAAQLWDLAPQYADIPEAERAHTLSHRCKA